MTLPLFERFPGTRALSRVELCELPTPVEHLPVVADTLGDDDEPLHPMHALYVKRDDLTAEAYGGNKVRKLEFLLGDAKAKGATSVITFGAYGSNHALATAVYARSLGMEPHVILSPQEPGPFAPRTLLAHAALGSVIHVIEGWDGTRKAAEVRRMLRERDASEPYIIPGGGSNAMGAIGYVNAALEVLAQAKVLDLGFLTIAVSEFVEPDAVYVPAGTLSTAVGLAVGFAAAGVATRTIGVRVTPAELASRGRAQQLAEETVALLRSCDESFPDLSFGDLRFELRDDWFDPGYGIPTPETHAAVALAEEGGLHLETTYTGKAFAAMVADADAGLLRETHALFWDTYSSAPYPAPGPLEALPPVLQDYVAECRRLFPDAP